MAKKTTIRCPHCGTEYLPGEIYLPKAFLGQPTDIIRDHQGNILGFQGYDMNTTEEFICDKCDKKFSVDASVSFKTSVVNDIFDSNDYISKI